MATKRLLWFFLSRTALLGLVLGAALGLVYGATLLLGSLLVTCVMDFADCSSGTSNPVGGALHFVMFGAAFGLLLGAPAGLMLGLVDGLLLGVLTRLFYQRPPTKRGTARQPARSPVRLGFCFSLSLGHRAGSTPPRL
jgi:hypothetical protein